ncbi:hypothetical protein CUC43_17650 [Bacillus thuringiensis LM1212]|uniref:hypothetical protein n=1 Tax=Bacillus cereus group TaxID=86661 RepID=UPI0003FBF3C3|nr:MULTISPECIES: hypothetical protein [Bacillus cereus group]AXY08518.1 hypothetical protein CUC43_17650 [Bacillus thuringiensis LM1212]QDF26809.1 hypothetical protein FJR70_29425 [Bacillus tropicus]QUG94757.1 hypothetical protein HCM98_07315 [Bacillus tropicus]
MKKYTGFEAIERMKTNVIDDGKSLYRYNMELNLVEFSMKEPNKIPWQNVYIDISFFFRKEFVDYVEPLKVGDWIYLKQSNGNNLVGKIKRFHEIYKNTVITDASECAIGTEVIRKATSEEIEKEKRRRVFEKAGRTIDEFKEGDVVTPLDNDKALLLVEHYSNQKNAVKIGGTYYNASDVNPAYFAESKVC